MKIQSLSIAVPAGCTNDCAFCVAKMHRGDYKNQLGNNYQFKHLYRQDFKTRLAFARDNGCNSLMYTGDGEPLLNKDYMEMVAEMNKQLEHPFRMIELQTSGYDLTEETLRWLRNEIGITTISLSMSAFNDDETNHNYNGTPDKLFVDTIKVARLIKKYDINLRLSLNMTDAFDKYLISNDGSGYFKNLIGFFEDANSLYFADQIIFRKLYTSYDGSSQDEWVKRHGLSSQNFSKLRQYITTKGRALEQLPFGEIRYSINNWISVVIDQDCMAGSTNENIKYLVLREDCKLYTKWDDNGSKLF